MTIDYYQPPGSGADPNPQRKGRPVFAVILAVVVDVVVSITMTVLLTFLYFKYLSGQGLSENDIIKKFGTMSPTSPFSLLGMAMGCVITCLSGFLCATIAKRDALICVIIYSLVTAIIGDMYSGSAGLFERERLLFATITIGSALLGYRAYRKKSG